MKKRNRSLKYNVVQIQEYYNLGNTWKQTRDYFKMSDATLFKYVKLGLFKTSENRSLRASRKGDITSQETKDKISKSRIKYLIENPDKVPYKLNHSSKESYPEKLLRVEFEKRDIKGWIQEYQNGIYSYDFAFPELKLDIEIDGETHLQEKIILIDKRRDEWSKSKGWKVLRFTAKQVKSNIDLVINEIMGSLVVTAVRSAKPMELDCNQHYPQLHK